MNLLAICKTAPHAHLSSGWLTPTPLLFLLLSNWLSDPNDVLLLHGFSSCSMLGTHCLPDETCEERESVEFGEDGML
ncbi:hypothetical protein GGR50DRAFT_670238 [Xylaria sp. CBS 124048]|nr:hypothetical protein GGR50DRAFT_670238 [Xylaria sp. CBS 124048]